MQFLWNPYIKHHEELLKQQKEQQQQQQQQQHAPSLLLQGPAESTTAPAPEDGTAFDTSL